MYKLAIFDMDGTILDTIEDLKDSANFALKECGHYAEYDISEMNRFFGSGVKVAIERALATEAGYSKEEVDQIGDGFVADLDNAEVQKIIAKFEEWYPEHCNIKTKAFDGIIDCINILNKKGILTAVVSNKMHEAAVILAEKYFKDYFKYVQGVEEGVRRKPNPDATLKIMRELSIAKENTVYIGDTEVDIETAKNAGIPCISVDWGFRSLEKLVELGAKPICSTVQEMYKEIIK